MNVVISGASSGIGLALARHYLERGATVAAIARRSKPLQTLAAEFPDKVFCYALDVRDAAALRVAANDFVARAGLPDVVIANAGVSVGTLTEYTEDEEVFRNIMDINVLGMVHIFQPFVAQMRANSSPDKGRQGGVLVGVASVAGLRGLPGAGAYSASKAAAISYLESLRVELHGSGVRVVTLCPGYVRTPMTEVNPYPMPFMLEPDEAARRMARVIERGKTFAIVPWQMGLVGRALKLLPNWLYDRLFAHAPRKPRRRDR